MSRNRGESRAVIYAAWIAGACTIIAALVTIIFQYKSSAKPDQATPRAYRIAGTVIDGDTYEGVAHAEISITGRTETVITEDNGNFSFEVYQLKPSLIRLRVQKRGYKLSEQAVMPPVEQKQVLLKK